MAESSSVNTTYEPFSREPVYIEANQAFVGRLPLSGVRRMLDLACGTGTVSEMLLAAAPEASLVGIDLDPVQIELAASHFADLGFDVRRGLEPGAEGAYPEEGTTSSRRVTFAVGSADELPLDDASVDCVTIANAIHLIEDKPKLLACIARVLRPGGLFAFNSGFYAGCYPPGTEMAFTEWVKEATVWIERRNAERRAAGQEPVRRVRGTTRAAFQNRWQSADDWRELLDRAGFDVSDVHERTVTLDAAALAAIGAYGGMAKVALSGYPVELASAALEASVAQAMRNMKRDTLPRNWLEMTAVRRAA